MCWAMDDAILTGYSRVALGLQVCMKAGEDTVSCSLLGSPLPTLKERHLPNMSSSSLKAQ
ncbi:mCG1028980 [Mus musculus]|nr:mCG1028980 [Mus musculus]